MWGKDKLLQVVMASVGHFIATFCKAPALSRMPSTTSIDVGGEGGRGHGPKRAFVIVEFGTNGSPSVGGNVIRRAAEAD